MESSSIVLGIDLHNWYLMVNYWYSFQNVVFAKDTVQTVLKHVLIKIKFFENVFFGNTTRIPIQECYLKGRVFYYFIIPNGIFFINNFVQKSA